MEHIMRIRWDTGYMVIDLDQFFPASTVKLRKLLKIIRLDWARCDSLTDELKAYFSEKAVLYGAEAEKARLEAFGLQESVCALERLTETLKKLAATKSAKAEYRQAAKELREAKRELKDLASSGKKYAEDAKRFQRLLDEVVKRSA